MSSRIKSFVKRCFANLGWDVRSLKYANTEEVVLKDILRLTSPAAVLDVGANVGQFARLVRSTGYPGVLISFEAIPSVHEVLSSAARADPRWLVAPCGALGARAGEIDINVSANTVSSSVLPMHEAHRRMAPDSAYVSTQTIKMRRLDDFAQDLLPPQGDIFLKIDTQGYEQEVLRGATGLLSRIVAMQVEISLIPLYDRAPTFAAMVDYIESLGYELFNLVPGFKDLRSGRVIQVDGFFVLGEKNNALTRR